MFKGNLLFWGEIRIRYIYEILIIDSYRMNELNELCFNLMIDILNMFVFFIFILIFCYLILLFIWKDVFL